MEERQLVKVVGNKDMTSVELRRAPGHPDIEGIGKAVALVGAVVHALRERVRRAELKAIIKPPVPSHLERVIHGVSNIVRFANGAETLVGPKSIDVDAFVSGIGNNGEGRLVNVRFAFQVHAAASDISKADDGLPE